jgi:hypothetical protein
MTKLSSRYTRFFKVVFPAYWFGFLALFVGVGDFAGDARIMPAFVLIEHAQGA